MQLLRFLLVGTSSALAYAIICTILSHAFPTLKGIISISTHVALVPAAFLGQRHITFRSTGPWLGEFIRYAALQALSITLSTVVLIELVTGNPWTDIPAFLAIAGLAAIVSFFTCRLAIFRNAKPQT